MGGWRQMEERGSKIPLLSSSLLFLQLSCFYISRLSVSVSRVCAPTLPLTNNVVCAMYVANMVHNVLLKRTS